MLISSWWRNDENEGANCDGFEYDDDDDDDMCSDDDDDDFDH